MTNHSDIERLFKTHYAQMHRTALAMLHDADLARDIVHDVFASLLDNDAACMPAGAGYLIRAVRNRCINHIRNCDIRRRVASLYALDIDEYDTEVWPDEQTIARIHSLIASDLTPQARRVVQLRFSDGLPFAQVAAAMGISETAVYRHLRHALTVIRQKLRENG